jgi:hypothetical protein
VVDDFNIKKVWIIIDSDELNPGDAEAFKEMISLTKIPVETIDSQDMEALVRYEAQLATGRMDEQLSEAPRIPRKKGQPAGSDKHSDLYTDEDPEGTIHGLGFKDVETAKASVKKIEGSDRTHAHKIQAAIAMEQRAKVMGKNAEAAIYRVYIEKMKKKTKDMNEKAPDTQDAMKRFKSGKAGFTDRAHLKAKGLIKRSDGTKMKSNKYK